jgi:DNA-binding HxlR family transcriptional regulator
MKDQKICILDQNSGPRQLLEVIGDKWAVLTIYALQTGTMRFNAIERALPGVSQKMLAQTLKRLQASGLVSRLAYAEVPPRVEYRLTDLGVTLAPVTEALCRWADEHGPNLATPKGDGHELKTV